MRRRERGKKEENMVVESRERLLLNLLDGSCVGGGASQTEMGGLWELQGRRGGRAAMYAKARKQRNSPPGPVFLQAAVSNMA